ncbi:MAG: Methyltransferase type 11 [Parcubacteria group bacterium GW2011_GWC2_45_7]|nr:MAG: Methyltransferase type 11 [Parcubacteria group bacterium GW2011_GWC2_45_7]
MINDLVMKNKHYVHKLLYDGERYIPGQTADNVRRDHEKRYQHVRKFVKGQRVLDVACGSGFGIKILSFVSRFIVGVDYAFEAVSFARQEHLNPDDGVVQASATGLPFVDRSFESGKIFKRDKTCFGSGR